MYPGNKALTMFVSGILLPKEDLYKGKMFQNLIGSNFFLLFNESLP